MTIDKIVKEIRTQYTWDWKLSNQEAQKLILDYVQKRVKEELKRCKQYHECEEDV
jgi:uncharacterized protein involved in tolerance to divalent cations